MTERNKHGLGRHIPDAIKREVRQRCGFGCVRCGLAFYDYEHFDPDFKYATAHRAEGITLLCSQCNQKRARGTLSAETVARANRAPKCLDQGFAREHFDVGPDQFAVVIGGCTFINCNTTIELNGISILSMHPPEFNGAPWRLSGKFADETGDVTLVVRENEWAAGADNWDVECVGKKITIRRGPRNIVLVVRQEPPHRIIVERLEMEFEGIRVRCVDGQLMISPRGDDWTVWSGCTSVNSAVGIKYANGSSR